MGNSNKKDNLKNKANEKADELMKKKESLENSLLTEELSKREGDDKKKDKKKSKKKNLSSKKTKFGLNIFMYSNYKIAQTIVTAISQYNSEVFEWNTEVLTGFNKENSEIIYERCETDLKKNQFKDVVILSIQSISDFQSIIEQDGKDIFEPFNDLTEEQQPFFLIIDTEKEDFAQYKAFIEVKNSVEDEKVLDYQKFNDDIIHNIISFKRKEYDFELKFDFFIELLEKIKTFKEYVLRLKKDKDDFEIYVNNELYYQNLYNAENLDILDSSNFEQKFETEIESKNNILQISLILSNVNISEFNEYYELLGITKAEFLIYEFKKPKLNNILRSKKYEYLDKRNFNVVRFKQSPKNILLKYTGYFNQLGDVLFCDQINFYPAKINIAIGGYIGSGKSTLINTIFGEKRCLEGQGSSITNYISQFSLKDYPINFYDFPGFRAKQDGKDNTSLFIEEIKSKISNLKKMNEVIHCFLFCIKFQERIFDENDKDMMEVFDSIAKLKIRTFFIITGSEKQESRQFKNFKKIIITNLTKVKAKYKDGDAIFGEDLDKSIIPILSRDKKFHEFTAKAFGLDNLFKVLHEYFLPKKIDFQKEIFFDEENLKIFIQNNELLKIFESKNKLVKDFRSKIESQLNQLLMKIFLKAPKYLYSFSEESLYELMNEFMDKIFYLFNYYLNQKSNVEKLQVLNKLYDIKNKINRELLSKMEEELEIKKTSDDFKNNVPLALKILFPILSPFYYIFGTPIIAGFSGKIINSLLQEMEIDNMLYETYFEELISNLNKAIDDLDVIRNNFEDNYILEKFESKLIKIIENENNEINSNDLNELKNIFTELLKKYENPLTKFRLKDLFDSFKNYFSSDKNLQDIANKKLDAIYSTIEKMIPEKSEKNLDVEELKKYLIDILTKEG